MTQAPSFLSEPQVVDLPRLIQDVRQGDIQVPRFQRPFVWDDLRRIELLRSIRSGIPIGSLLVWRTSSKRLGCFDRIAGVPIPRPPDGRTISFLLDGHQRVTSIFGAFTFVAATANLESQKDDSPAPLVYNVDKDDFEVSGAPGNDLRLPLQLLLDAVSLRRSFRLMEKEQIRPAEQLDLLQSRAEEVLKSFERCRIPIIPLTTEDVGLATRTFHRVNSQGFPMAEIHMVAALTWKEDFDLREEIERAWATQELVEHWKPTDDQQVLNVIKGAFNLEVAKASEEKLIRGLAGNPGVVKHAVKALASTMRFASEELYLSGPGAVPYEMQITLTAAALVRADLSAVKDVEQARRWWGLTTVWGTFAGGASHRVQAAFRHLTRGVAGIREPWPDVLFRTIEPVDVPALDFRNARAKYFADGYARATGNEDLLRSRGSRALVSLFRGLTTAPGNRFIWRSEKIGELHQLLWEGDFLALRGHFIDEDCVQLYRAKLEEDFVARRAALMNAFERKWFEGLRAAEFIAGVVDGVANRPIAD